MKKVCRDLDLVSKIIYVIRENFDGQIVKVKIENLQLLLRVYFATKVDNRKVIYDSN